jgi:hypothetical protein
LITGVLGFLTAALVEWVSKLSEIEYPAEEFGLDVTYPDGFWLDGILLFFGVTIAGSLLSLCVRNAVVTVDGYQRPTGLIRLQIVAHLVTGLGVACSSLNPAIGPLVFMVGLACLVVSLQQKCPHHSDLLES